MKLELHNNDYIDIVLNEDDGAYIAYGKIDEYDVFGEFYNIESSFDHDDFIEAVRLLGYNIGMVENEVKDYLRNKDCYIKVSLKPTEKIKYSFVDLVTDEIICSSNDFLELIKDEILEKENNASLQN